MLGFTSHRITNDRRPAEEFISLKWKVKINKLAR